jgi:hypothetical protein
MGMSQKNSRAKALQGDPYPILKPALCYPDLRYRARILSVAAALNPRRWTILPRLGPPSRAPILPRRDRALRRYSIFDPMSSPLPLSGDKKFYEHAVEEHLPVNSRLSAALL